MKTEFLHGDLQEDVYRHQPESYVVPGNEYKACKLKKALYGLKQAARPRNFKIHQPLPKLGFHQAGIDKCLYKQTQKGKTTYVIVCDDNFLISGENQNFNIFVNLLKQEYQVTNLGEAKYYHKY